MKAFLYAMAAVLASAVPSKSKYSKDKVFTLTIETEDQRQLVDNLVQKSSLGLDLWTDLVIGSVDLHIPATLEKDILARLAGIKHKVMIEDLGAVIDAERITEISTKSLVSGKMTAEAMFTAYQDADTLNAYLRDIPGTTPISLGKTYEGRTIEGVKFGSGAKHIVFNGGIHAREWISPAVVTYIADYLAGDSADAVKLRSKFTFHVVPVLNPDGYAYTRNPSGDRMWRKNRQPNAGSSCIGTDPNRNFDAKWSGPGASSDECNDTYYGTAPESTAEAKGISQYVASLGKGNVISYTDFHAYSQLWLYPWGYTCDANVPDKDVLDKVSRIGAQAIRGINGKSFTVGPTCQTIYRTSGGSNDAMYDKYGVKYAFALELRPTQWGGSGFALPANQIVPAGKETLAGMLAVFNYIADNE